MERNERLLDLLTIWEERQEAGEPISVADLCRDDPDLRMEVEKKIAALMRMRWLVPSSDESEPNYTGRPVTPAVEIRHESLARLQPGSQPVPDYQLVGPLGRGGFGEVWKAIGPGGIPIALKFVVLDEKAGPIEQQALQIIKDVRHPHLRSTVASWQQDGLLIIAMELADRTLFDRLKEAKEQGLTGIPGPELVAYLQDAAEGIDYLNEAHPSLDGSTQLGIQHRDIKPSNLLLVGGSVKVADFGLARILTHTVTSHSGKLTVAYAAPEFFNDQTSRHSDQYSLAVAYCELRGGRLPFTGNDAQVMGGHVNRAPDLTMLPERERAIVARALAKEPSKRWPSCRSFVTALRATEAGEIPANDLAVQIDSPPRSIQVTGMLSKNRFQGVRYSLFAGIVLAGILGLIVWSAGVFAPGNKPTPTGREGQSNSATTPIQESYREIGCLRGHTGTVAAVAFTPDGERAVSCAEDRTIRVWSLKEGKEIGRLAGHNQPISTMALSPDGRQSLSASGSLHETEIIHWEIDAGRIIRRWHGHDHTVLGLAFLPDGKRAVSGSFDNTIRLWDLEHGQEIRRFDGFTKSSIQKSGFPSQVWCLALSRDRKQLLAGVRDTTIRLFDVESGKEVKCLQGHTKYVNSVGFVSDAKEALSGNGDIHSDIKGEADNTLRLWNLAEGIQKECYASPVGSIRSVVVAPDGKKALIVGENRVVVFWDIQKGREIVRMQGHTASVRCAAFSSDGQRAITGSADQTCRVWKLPPRIGN